MSNKARGQLSTHSYFRGCRVHVMRIYGLGDGLGLTSYKPQAPVVQRLDNAIHWINRYPVDKC